MSVTTAELSLLHRKFGRLHRARHRRIAEGLGLYYGQPVMLMMLFENGEMTQKELSEHMNITPASVAVSVKRMEKAGLLEKKSDPDDLRLNRIALTKKGESSAVQCENGFRKVDECVFRGFSEDELERLSDFFKRMISNLE